MTTINETYFATDPTDLGGTGIDGALDEVLAWAQVCADKTGRSVIVHWSNGSDSEPYKVVFPAKKVSYPSVEELDTGTWSEHSGRSVSLYLCPADECDDGQARIKAFHRVGPSGTPEPAYHGRWRHLVDYGPQVVGESVLDALEAREDEWLELAAQYEGSQWDGGNHVGTWSDAERWCDSYEAADSRAALVDEFARYQDGSEVVREHAQNWEELAQYVRVDPERAYAATDAELEELAREVASELEDLTEGAVSGLLEAVLDLVTPARTRRHCQCGEITGHRCDWIGPADEVVTVEWMPPAHRDSHNTARNSGRWPANGALRLTVSDECAELLEEAEGEYSEWLSVVGE